MWDGINNTEEWVLSQVPELIRTIYENDLETVEKKFGMRQSLEEIDFATVALCYVNIIGGALFSMGFKYAGTGNREVRNIILKYIEIYRKKLKTVSSVPVGVAPLQGNLCGNTKN
jgi:hypothetical protein